MTAPRTHCLTGAGALLRLALRRDRVFIPGWVAGTALLVLSMPKALGSVYATAAERAELVRSTAGNGSLRALYGPLYGDSLGALTAWRSGVFAAILAAAMSLMIVVRHTREDEEEGRHELLGALPVGRLAPLAAALGAAGIANLLVAIAIGAGLAGQGAAGAVALGLAVAGAGLTFAGLAACAAQWAGTARAARGVTVGLLGSAFALRAVADAGGSGVGARLGGLSPLGWVTRVRPFASVHLWPLGCLLAAGVLSATLAVVASTRRDLGAGLFAARPGPAGGGPGSCAALALRLQRGALLGWAAGFLVAGLVFGAMARGAGELVGTNENSRRIIERMGGGGSMTDAFLATMVGMFGLVATLFAVGSALRPHAEESGGRAEWLLGAPVGRLRWAGAHLGVAFLGSVVLLLAAGAGLALGHGQDGGRLLGASLAQVPAVWVLAGVAALLYGAVPRFAVGAWAVAGIVLALGWVGPALDLPARVLDLSPFAHLPKLPAPPGSSAVSAAPFLVTVAVATLLTALGLAALRRRDLRT
ncbi:ABC transporter permease [Streptomyces sp. BI20]|uniref:ABC transporter permease n=1 Tax=Streptomyces sp. BI20 TaxID=3403460 RepID=UPI003C722229